MKQHKQSHRCSSLLLLHYVQAKVVTENLQEEEEDTMTRTTCQSHVIGTKLYFTLDFVAVSSWEKNMFNFHYFICLPPYVSFSLHLAPG